MELPQKLLNIVDHFAGLPGIGEKTALKLLQEYETLDNIYANLDKISGKLKEKLVEFKEDAYNSYDIATIYTKVPMEIDINDALYKEKDTNIFFLPKLSDK